MAIAVERRIRATENKVTPFENFECIGEGPLIEKWGDQYVRILSRRIIRQNGCCQTQRICIENCRRDIKLPGMQWKFFEGWSGPEIEVIRQVIIPSHAYRRSVNQESKRELTFSR